MASEALLGDYAEAERTLWLLALGAALASPDARALLKALPDKCCVLVDGQRMVAALNSGRGPDVWRALEEIFFISKGDSSTAVEALYARLKDRIACRTLRDIAVKIADAVEGNREAEALGEARRLATFIQGEK